ncbi:MAG: hypothetical protein EOO24_27175 [Comamonadaceae bacterium]|nr:MAG: hypothetical protein EOO24_27175 [Comamonadaceae bacterium]
MTFHVDVHDGPGYPRVVAHGVARYADVIRIAEVVATAAAERGATRALIDLRHAEPALTLSDHLAVGEHAARCWTHLNRVASAVASQDRIGTSELSARARGANLRTFVTIEDAERWLSE